MERDVLRWMQGQDWSPLLVAIGAVLARGGAAIWITPFLGGKLVPIPLKIGLMLTLAIILGPHVSSSVAIVEAASPLVLSAILIKEALVGAAIGFLMAIVFWAAEASGALVDTVRGANWAEVLVPQLGSRSSPLGNLYFQLALVLFITLGGHRMFLMALGASYQVLPIASFPRFAGLKGFAFLCCRLTADLIFLALSLAAPVLAALFLTDLTLGLINRFVPQLNVFFLALPAKALVGIAILALVIGLLAGVLPGILNTAVLQVTRAMEILAR